MSADPKIRKVATKVILGEGPHWDERVQALYYVDIKGHAFYKYSPNKEQTTCCKFPEGTVSLVVPDKASTDKFVVGYNRKIVIVTWDGVSGGPSKIEDILEVENEEHVKTNRFNDGKCDPFGRLYAGTMGYEPKIGQITHHLGSLYLIDIKKRTSKKLVSDITIANGLAWDLQRKKMYYIDTMTYRVDQFDYDQKTGNISNRQPAFDFKKNNIGSLPDGMCIDSKGNLWVCCFNGGQVLHVDPVKSKLLRTIPLPARQTTSVAFGGPNLDILYVTSAALEEEEENPNAGCVYEITNLGDVRGLPGDNIKLD